MVRCAAPSFPEVRQVGNQAVGKARDYVHTHVRVQASRLWGAWGSVCVIGALLGGLWVASTHSVWSMGDDERSDAAAASSRRTTTTTEVADRAEVSAVASEAVSVPAGEQRFLYGDIKDHPFVRQCVLVVARDVPSIPDKTAQQAGACNQRLLSGFCLSPTEVLVSGLERPAVGKGFETQACVRKPGEWVFYGPGSRSPMDFEATRKAACEAGEHCSGRHVVDCVGVRFQQCAEKWGEEGKALNLFAGQTNTVLSLLRVKQPLEGMADVWHALQAVPAWARARPPMEHTVERLSAMVLGPSVSLRQIASHCDARDRELHKTKIARPSLGFGQPVRIVGKGEDGEEVKVGVKRKILSVKGESKDAPDRKELPVVGGSHRVVWASACETLRGKDGARDMRTGSLLFVRTQADRTSPEKWALVGLGGKTYDVTRAGGAGTEQTFFHELDDTLIADLKKAQDSLNKRADKRLAAKRARAATAESAASGAAVAASAPVSEDDVPPFMIFPPGRSEGLGRQALLDMEPSLRMSNLLEGWNAKQTELNQALAPLCRQIWSSPEGIVGCEAERKAILALWSHLKERAELVDVTRAELRKQGRLAHEGTITSVDKIIKIVDACVRATDGKAGNADPAEFFFKRPERLLVDVLEFCEALREASRQNGAFDTSVLGDAGGAREAPTPGARAGRRGTSKGSKPRKR